MIQDHIFNIVSKSGFGKPALRAYESLGQSVTSFHPDIHSGLKDGWNVNIQGRVLIPITHGSMGVNTTLNCCLAHLFFARGFEPLLTVCDGDLPACIKMDPNNQEVSQATCDLCTYTGFNGIKEFGLEEQLEVFDVEETPNINSGQKDYNGIDISRYALSTTRKVLNKYTIDLSNQLDHRVYTNMLQTCAVLVDEYERIFEDFDIQAVVASHPLYYHGGIPMAVGRSRDIPIYAWSPGRRNQSAIFTRMGHEIQPQYNPEKEITETKLSQPLSAVQTNQIENYMENRKQGKDLNSYQGQFRKGTLDITTNTIGVFTNLLWDGTPRGHNGTFDDAFDWLRITLEVLSNVGADVIVKTHPAESLRGTNESVYEKIITKYESLPSNIRVLPPDTNVNTYEVLAQIEAGVVWTSTVGLEMAYEGIPVVVGGDPHYRNLNITFDPDTKDMYKKTLNNILNLQMDKRRELHARRYAYHLFIAKHIDFPFYTTDDTGGWNPVPVSKDMFNAGVEPFDTLVHNIVNHEPVSHEFNTE